MKKSRTVAKAIDGNALVAEAEREPQYSRGIPWAAKCAALELRRKGWTYRAIVEWCHERGIDVKLNTVFRHLRALERPITTVIEDETKANKKKQKARK